MSSIAIRRIHSISGPAIGAIALVASAWFLARIVHVVQSPEPDATAASVAPEEAAAPTPEAPAAPLAPRRDGAALVARNMFCARCTGTKPPEGGGKRGEEARRFTARLIATSVVSAAYGTATLVDPATGSGGAFPTGAVAPGGATIVAVRRDAIDVRHADEQVETVWLSPDAGPARPEPEPGRPEPAATAWGERVRAVGEDRFEVDRRMIGELVGGGTTAAVPGVRLMPVMRDGNLAGIKVAAARAGSLARALGLELGDVIEAIDGQPITSTQMLLDLYGKVDQLTRLELTVRRKGASRALAYDLR